MKENAINEDFLLYAVNGVIKLLPPEQANLKLKLPSVKEIFALQANAYFQQNGLILDYNEHCYLTCASASQGYFSRYDLIGKTMDCLFLKNQYICRCLQQERSVFESNKMKVFQNNVRRLDELELNLLSFKYPCVNHHNQLIGIFGIAIVLNPTNLAPFQAFSEVLECIIEKKLLNSDYVSESRLQVSAQSRMIYGVVLSEIQFQCLRCLVCGMTAKKTAKLLNLSYRTIEHHLEKIKFKFKVNSKSDLISKVIDQFLV